MCFAKKDVALVFFFFFCSWIFLTHLNILIFLKKTKLWTYDFYNYPKKKNIKV